MISVDTPTRYISTFDQQKTPRGRQLGVKMPFKHRLKGGGRKAISDVDKLKRYIDKWFNSDVDEFLNVKDKYGTVLNASKKLGFSVHMFYQMTHIKKRNPLIVDAVRALI